MKIFLTGRNRYSTKKSDEELEFFKPRVLTEILSFIYSQKK